MCLILDTFVCSRLRRSLDGWCDGGNLRGAQISPIAPSVPGAAPPRQHPARESAKTLRSRHALRNVPHYLRRNLRHKSKRRSREIINPTFYTQLLYFIA